MDGWMLFLQEENGSSSAYLLVTGSQFGHSPIFRPDLEADCNQLPPGFDVDDLQCFVTLYRDHCEVHNQTKNDSHWHHFM